ncbi:hypothetical protein [Xylella fastidiosa]|nr:hypothetical protein [Xylella fastidiosa]
MVHWRDALMKPVVAVFLVTIFAQTYSAPPPTGHLPEVSDAA